MTKKTLLKWIKNVLDESVSKPTLLLQDSWTGQSEEELFTAGLSNGTLLEIGTIPPKVIRYGQPLDVCFPRQYNLFVRRFMDEVRGLIPEKIDTRLNDRVFMVIMQLFAHDQLWGPGFRGMLL